MPLGSRLIKDVSLHLTRAHWQLVTAESCTGGMIASAITGTPGSSHWFERGFVTYSNLSKQELLGVSDQILIQFGAVSEQTALAMAVGALNHSVGHIALAVTGIAGPDGGTIEKPVGTVCFGWAVKGGVSKSSQKIFPGDREAIRRAACKYALEGVLSLLKES